MENVEAHFKEILKTRKIHLTLIDPDEQSPEEAVSILMNKAQKKLYLLLKQQLKVAVMVLWLEVPL